MTKIKLTKSAVDAAEITGKDYELRDAVVPVFLWVRKDNPQGSDHVLLDLGFDDAEELSAKAALALKLNGLIDQRGLSKMEAAAITGMTQPKVSQVRSYKLHNISLERLMHALVSLDQHVEIVMQPARQKHMPGITVAA